ncbi:MAG: hypothetical protein E6Q97_19160 [Desulfurellales bacterium]|nr:MAG: hypothetical protein E6Q97_19160 [Desulfurellales bacterium]
MAQAVQCANQPAGNSTNACANTRFVTTAITAICSTTPSFCQTLLGYTFTAWYGAACNGSTDDTTAITNTIAATNAGGVMYVQNGQCLVSGSGSQIFLIATKVIKIRGYGMSVTGTTGTTFYIATGVPVSRDLFRITGTTGSNLRGYEFSEFNVTMQSGTGGRHVFHFDSTGGAATNFSEVLINRVYAAAGASAGGYSVYLNNTGGATIQGGFYNSDITQSWLGGGIGSTLTGDSIRVTNNIISTANAGVTINQVAGAGNFTVRNNNISGTAGCVVVTGAVSPVIEDNICEQQATNTEANNSMIDLIGSTSNISSAKILKNQVQANAATGNPTLVRVATATGTVIEGNRLATPAVYAAVVITAAATGTIYGADNTLVAGTITDGGTGTLQMVSVPFGSGGTAQVVRRSTAAGAFSVSQLAVTELGAINANTVVGNFTGSSANPAANAMPSCSTSTSALNYTSGTGVGCVAFGTAALQNTGTSGANVPLMNGTNTWSGGQLITTTTAGTAPFSVTSTDSGAVAGPILQIYRNSSSPAAADVLGNFQFLGNNTTPVSRAYGGFQVRLIDATPASEDGAFDFTAYVAGADGIRATVGNGFSVGTTTMLGIGTVNANTFLKSGIVAVGSLPTCNASTEGARYGVSDSNAASYTAGIGAIVAGGGATRVPVYCDGTNWRIG